jgi:rod shape-determining protein MreC
MKNIIRFLFQHHYAVLFVVLETLSLMLVVLYNPYHKGVFISSANSISASLFKKSSIVEQFFTLQETNLKLAEENAFIKSRLPESFQLSASYMRLVSDSLSTHQYIYRSCRVINNSVNKQYNFLTLDKGRIHGIRKEMGVISPDGVVGIIRNTSANYTTVISILNTHLKISAKIKETGYFGSIEWTGKSPQHAFFNEIPLHAKVKQGDLVVTSGFSSIFPENIPIGVVEEVTQHEGESFYRILVKLSVDFKKLAYVEVIENTMREERIMIEKETENE